MSGFEVDPPAGDVHTLAVEALELLDDDLSYVDRLANVPRVRELLERIRDIVDGVRQAIDADLSEEVIVADDDTEWAR